MPGLLLRQSCSLLLHQSARALCKSAAKASAAAAAATAAVGGGGGGDDTELVELRGGRQLRLSRSWLRLNCQCDSCWNSATQQRQVSPAEALSRSELLAVRSDEEAVVASWADGHESRFGVGQLLELLQSSQAGGGGGGVRRSLWAGGDLNSRQLVAPVSADALLSNEPEGRRAVLRNLWQFGFATVEGVEASAAATERIVAKVAPVMPTFYGGLWTFTADGRFQDTAYGRQAIGLHTDTTYLANCAGLQVFHALQNAPVGGSTGLADGFRAAETLRSEEPRHFELLLNWPVYHQYVECSQPGDTSRLVRHHRCLDTVLKVDPEAGGALLQIRYNPFDLAPLSTLRQQEARDWLAAYAHLGDILGRRDAVLWQDLRPGAVLFIDNWRVLHARSAFEGRRVLCGCYVSRDEWTSAARTAGGVC